MYYVLDVTVYTHAVLLRDVLSSLYSAAVYVSPNYVKHC